MWSHINWRESKNSNWYSWLILKFYWLNFGCFSKVASMIKLVNFSILKRSKKLRNINILALPEAVSLGPDTNSIKTFQGTFSAQDDCPPTTLTLILSGQVPTLQSSLSIQT